MSARTGALRRRRKRSLLTRLRVMWVFIAVIAGALAYAAYVFVTLPALRAGAVDVRIDGLTVSREAVLQAARIDPRSNVWLLRTDAIARRIEAIPYVDTAAVDRVPPARITIAVTEREPAACVVGGAQTVTIDRTRRVLQTGCARADGLELIVPPGPLGAPGTIAVPSLVAPLLADARALADAGLTVRSLTQDRFGQLVAVDAQGLQLLFGSDADLASKAKLVPAVLAAGRQPGRVVRSVDLRSPATPTVVFR